MRLKRLYLRGYANIYNAMSRYELDIDFSKCIHNIIVIRSENGSGKSSIINELHPFFSPSILWLEDTEIQKTIEFFLEDGTDLAITYYGWKAVNTKQKPSRCYIQRIVNGIPTELNSTGNMNTGKDIICDLLDISDDYISLASISANSTGIGAMKPSERKRFLSLIVNSIEPFVKMHKMLASKYTVVKSMITTINAKISQLGNIEVIQSNMDKAIYELQILDSKKTHLIQTIADIKAKIDLISSNGSPLEQYQTLIREQSSLEDKINIISQDVIAFNEDELKTYQTEQIQLQAKIEALDSILQNYIQQEQNLKHQIEEDKIQLDSLYNQEILEDTKKRLDKAKKELLIYISRFNILGFSAYDDISEEEYILAIDTIEKINNTISYLASQYSRDELLEASNYINNNPDLIDCNTLIDNLQSKLQQIKDKIIQQQSLETQSKSYSSIPSDCSHKHDCPFIVSIVKANELKLSLEQLQYLYDEKTELVQLIEDTKKRLHKQNNLMQCIYQIRELVTSITSMSRLLLKFPNTQKLKNLKHIIECITNASSLDLDISQYREYTNYITLISSIKKDILSYEEKIESISNHAKESWLLKQQIENKSKSLQDISKQKLGYLAEINELKNRKLVVDDYINIMIQAQCSKLQYEQELKKLTEIKEKMKSLSKDVDLYKMLTTEYSKLSTELNNLSLTSIPELQNTIEQSKYQMMLYNQYLQEYNYYSDMFKKIESVKHAVSINGIQADIMDYTMNQILSKVNQLAQMIFGGRFILNRFDITATDFMISLYDKELGIIRPDISMMSASQLAQLSMIISFVLLHNSSKRFNIIRLDEVDNNLDNDNRLRFFDLINNIMNILNFHQAVIISHNTELDLSTCDLIITRLQNQESYRSLLNSGSNIIADFNR